MVLVMFANIMSGMITVGCGAEIDPTDIQGICVERVDGAAFGAPN